MMSRHYIHQGSAQFLSPLDSKVHLEYLGAASLTEELEELTKVHVVSSATMRVENSLLKPRELAQRIHIVRRVQRNILPVPNHDPLPRQHLHPEGHHRQWSHLKLMHILITPPCKKMLLNNMLL